MTDPSAPETEVGRLVQPLVHDEAGYPGNDVRRPEGGPFEDVATRVVSPGEQPVCYEYPEEGNEHRAEQEQEALVAAHVDEESAAGCEHGSTDDQHALWDSGEQVLCR